MIFCSTKAGCEKTAKLLAKLMPIPASQEIQKGRCSLMHELGTTPGGLDPIFGQTIMFGIAYHHSGLTVEERELIEDAFRAGLIHTLTCTSTLASGVNLPARRVIFRTPFIGRSFLDSNAYKQMKGRAGRKGKDVKGESILMCSKTELKRVLEMVSKKLEPVYSCLTSERIVYLKT